MAKTTLQMMFAKTEAPSLCAIVNGIQKCSVFGNYECSDFGIKTAVDSATMMQ